MKEENKKEKRMKHKEKNLKISKRQNEGGE